MFAFLCSTDADCAPELRLAQLLLAAFLAVLFLQSGLDKVTDRQGNLEWLTGHFAKSPLGGQVPMMLTVVTAAELAAGGFSALGVAGLLLSGSTTLAYLGVVFAAVSLLMLFFGQRLAKDYAGAAVLASYFLLVLFGIYLYAI
jgi:hypothetical protein